MLPQPFEQWKHCIEKECGIMLTKQFAEKRLAVYENLQSDETKKFIQLYGEYHLNNIIQWLQRTL